MLALKGQFPGGIMEHHDVIRRHLRHIEQLLREHDQWQSVPPLAAAFESTQPFCMDTLQPYEWLQWVLIPRMHALLEGNHPLPNTFAVAPYYEMALVPGHIGREAILDVLLALDAVFADGLA